MTGPQYDFEAIKSVAGKWGKEWDEKSGKALGHIKSAQLEKGDFSEAHSAAAFGTLHESAHQIYLATLRGVRKDLSDFQEKLRLAAETMEEKDGEAAQVMQSLAAKWTSDRGFHSDRARAKKVDKVAPEAAPAASGQEPADGTSAGAQPASDTSSDGTGQEVYGNDPSSSGGDVASPAADGNDGTSSYNASQNPNAANKPKY